MLGIGGMVGIIQEPDKPAQHGRWPFLAPRNPDVEPANVEPSLSLVITAYNVAAYLPEALKSVFAQTRPADEVIVCDDGSSDDVVGALAPWQDLVVLLRQPRRGEGAAKNTLLKASQCEAIVNLDGDDTMHPERLEAIAHVLQKRPDIDILTSEFDQFGPAANETPWRMADRFPVEHQRESILRWNFLPAPAIRRLPLIEVGGYAEHLDYGPDWECYARMVLNGSKAGMLLDPYYRYRRWSGQQTADRRRVLNGRVRVLDSISELDSLRADEHATVRASVARARLELARWELRHGNVDRRSVTNLATNGDLPWRSRAWAAGVALAPRVARYAENARGARR